jgi:outer membrane protein insertion porin family
MIKSSKFFSIFIAVLLTLTKTAFAFESYDDKKVEKIIIVLENGKDDESFDQKKILSRMKTKKGDNFSQLIFDTDLKMLSNDFDKVRPEIKIIDGKLDIILYVWPKPVIGKIVWEGNKQIASKTLMKKLEIKEGTVFSRKEFNKALNNVKEYYLKKGFFESQITYSIEQMSANSNEIKVVVDIEEGKSGHVKDIVFKGFTKDEKSDLREMMYIKKYNFLTSWMTGKGIFNKDALEQDRMTILDYLHNKGYADATVDIKILDDDSSDKIIIEITAHRGILYRIGKVIIEGNELIPTKELEDRIIIHENDVFAPEKVRDSIESIKEAYGKKGYIEAHINYETALHVNEPIYDIKFSIIEGKCFKIGLIRILGNQHTKSNVILRESLLVPGQKFDSRKLKATQYRLENIGYFENVNVYAVKSTDDLDLGDNYRDVYIEVKEKSTGSLSAFVGVSSLDDIFGGFDLTETNFNYKGIVRIFEDGPGAMRGGGEYLRGKINWGAKQRNIMVSWMTPYFRDTLWRFGYEISKTDSKLQSKDFNVKTYGGSVYASYPVTNYWTYGMKYRLRHESSTIHMSGSDSIDERKEKERLADNKGLLSAIGTSMVYDSTDNSYKARRGIRSIMEAEFSGIGGKFHFLKLNYLNTLYHPLWKKATMKYRAELRFIQPFGSTNYEKIPLAERLFVGGENTVRGYKPYIIGPRMIGNNKDPVGGISSSVFSVECSQEVFKLMDVFAFFDAGSVSKEKFTISKLRASCGVGARLELMNRVPITVGYGYPINREFKKDKQGYFFSMGGQF